MAGRVGIGVRQAWSQAWPDFLRLGTGSISVDPQRITQAMEQLAHNAVQHTHDGGQLADVEDADDDLGVQPAQDPGFLDEPGSDVRLVDRPDPRTTSVIAGSRIDLLEALERLERDKPLMVAPFVLRDLGQLEYTEIAEQLGIAIGTVRSRLHEARRAVQQSLTGNHT